jgi:hypothetical protein
MFFLSMLVETGTVYYHVETLKGNLDLLKQLQKEGPQSLRNMDIDAHGIRFEAYEALKSIGLDIQGGLDQLHKARRMHDHEEGILDGCHQVVNLIMARRYARLGDQFGVDVSEHPLNLDQAVFTYAQVAALVSNSETSKTGPYAEVARSTDVSVWLQKDRSIESRQRSGIVSFSWT